MLLDVCYDSLTKMLCWGSRSDQSILFSLPDKISSGEEDKRLPCKDLRQQTHNFLDLRRLFLLEMSSFVCVGKYVCMRLSTKCCTSRKSCDDSKQCRRVKCRCSINGKADEDDEEITDDEGLCKSLEAVKVEKSFEEVSKTET